MRECTAVPGCVWDVQFLKTLVPVNWTPQTHSGTIAVHSLVI